jgi:hypothetical protein
VHFLIRCTKLELVRKKSISKIIDKYKALANCNSEELFIWLLSNEDKEILIEISASIENLMTARAEMLVQQNKNKFLQYVSLRSKGTHNNNNRIWRLLPQGNPDSSRGDNQRTN